MVQNYGNAVAYSTGLQGIQLPTPDLHHRSTIPRCDCGRAISTQDARRDGLCRSCRQPEQAPVVEMRMETAYDQLVLTDEQLSERFTAPMTSTPAPDASPSATPPAPPAPPAADEGDVHGPASAGVEPASEPVEKRATVRAKVAQVSPTDVVISLHAPDGIITTAVAALLTDLLDALQTPAAPSPARGTAGRQGRAAGTRTRAASGKGKPKAARGTTGGRAGSTGKLAGHDAAIIARYQAGETPRAIAADYQCTDVAIRFLLKRNQITLRTASEAQRGSAHAGDRALAPDQETAAVTDYAAGGISMRDLATRYGCSENTIRNAIHRAGIPVRRPSVRVTRPSTTPTGDTAA